MIRKSLFWGLTLVLVGALVALIVRGRKMEKDRAAQPAEVIRQAPSSPTRVLAPQDLEIVSAAMQLKPDHTALHEVEIRNHGRISYGSIRLKVVYQDPAGKRLLEKTYALNKAVVPPGSSFKATGVVINEIPASTGRSQVSIQYADVLPPD